MTQQERPYRYKESGPPPSQEVLLLYISGKLSQEEEEQVAMFLEHNPLYAEAVEGLKRQADQAGESEKGTISLHEDISRINNDIDIITSHAEKGRKQPMTYQMWRYAAAAVLILVLAFSGYFLTVQLNQPPPPALSSDQKETQEPDEPIAANEQEQPKEEPEEEQPKRKPLEEGNGKAQNIDEAENEREAVEKKQEDQPEDAAQDGQKQGQATGEEKPASDQQASTSALSERAKDPASESSASQDEQKYGSKSKGSRKQQSDRSNRAGKQENNGVVRTQQPETAAKSVQPQADNLGGRVAKGVAQYQQENFEAALATLSQVLQERPEHLKARYFAGMAAFELRDYQQARNHFAYLVTPSPQHTYFEDALWYLGQTNLQQGDTTRAINVFERIHENQYQHHDKANKLLEQLTD